MFQPFLQFTIYDVLDILLVAVLIYQLYKLVRGTAAVNIFIGILALYLLWIVVEALQMRLLSQILGQFLGVGVIALIIVFQKELRRFLLFIGTTNIYRTNRLLRFLPWKWDTDKKIDLNISGIVNACKRMADSKTGAIIVIATKAELSAYSFAGVKIDAEVSESLIESIFFKNSPLHDGAILISKNRILAASCVLPVSEKQNFSVRMGIRHRAAAGVTETADVVAIAVSEETGEVSFSKEGELQTGISPEELHKLLTAEYN